MFACVILLYVCTTVYLYQYIKTNKPYSTWLISYSRRANSELWDYRTTRWQQCVVFLFFIHIIYNIYIIHNMLYPSSVYIKTRRSVSVCVCTMCACSVYRHIAADYDYRYYNIDLSPPRTSSFTLSMILCLYIYVFWANTYTYFNQTRIRREKQKVTSGLL